MWEYKIIELPLLKQGEGHARLLNDLGRERWELISVLFYPGDCYVAWFKRPKIESDSSLPYR